MRVYIHVTQTENIYTFQEHVTLIAAGKWKIEMFPSELKWENGKDRETDRHRHKHTTQTEREGEVVEDFNSAGF